jgi:hypothetical protein
MTMRFLKPRKLGEEGESWLRVDGRISECTAATCLYLRCRARRSSVMVAWEGAGCSVVPFCATRRVVVDVVSAELSRLVTVAVFMTYERVWCGGFEGSIGFGGR